MPELPEVETVRRGLKPLLVGRRIVRVDQRRPDLRFPFPERFADRLAGRRVTAVDRRAKYLLIRLDDGWTWLVHLGMSGRFTIAPGPVQTQSEQALPAQARFAQARSAQAGHNSGWGLVERHDHLLVELEDGGRVRFNDTRRFGFMDLIAPGGEAASPHLAGLGPEPLGPAFDAAWLDSALFGRATPIKAALLDQRVVAGLGNIYVCEALWRAGVSPRRLARSVTGARVRRLVPAIREVLVAAIAAGGSSLRDYVQADGELGYFQHAFDVYDRENVACRRPGCGGAIRRIVQSGRSTFYCPEHQR